MRVLLHMCCGPCTIYPLKFFQSEKPESKNSENANSESKNSENKNSENANSESKNSEKEKIEVMGFFYRHNIHPFSECLKREKTLLEYTETKGIKVICQQTYEIERFLQSVVFREKDRCKFCYYDRLLATAKVAKKGKFDFFSSTLLYSRFQNHDLIYETGKSVAKEVGIQFFYKDFRDGWKEGIQESKNLNMYRQRYCGCIYSEKAYSFHNNKD